MIRPIGKHLDALYLSVTGELPESLVNVLRAHKEEAQESETNCSELFNDEGIPGGTLWIQAKGTRGHEFVIRNSRIYLALSSQKHLPALNIQFMAEALYEYDLDGLQTIVDRLCTMFVPDHKEQIVSRADVAVDFQAVDDYKFELPEMTEVITRARRRRIEYDRAEAQTLTLGNHGGALQVQIYNKSAETAKTSKRWLEDVWAASGLYDPKKPVWRAEIRFYRDALSGFKVRGLSDLRRHLGDLLRYAADHEVNGSWVRFAEPGTRGLQVQTRGAAEWWAHVARKFLHGQVFTGRRRLRPKGVAAFSKAMDMYCAWAAKVAALARAGGLHGGGAGFGPWVHAYAQSHVRRNKGMSWTELVNQKIAELPDRQVTVFSGRLFDLARVHLDVS